MIIGAGRRPSTAGLGLDTEGVHPDQRGAIPVDQHCQAGNGVWAVGDVTGISLFTHVADNILGRPRAACYDDIPRVVFVDPEIAAVGLTTEQANQQGIAAAATKIGLADSIARPWTYERDPRGALGLLADRDRQVLVAARAVAPLASEWIHQAALAIRASIPLDVLLDQVAQFPTYTAPIRRRPPPVVRQGWLRLLHVAIPAAKRTKSAGRCGRHSYQTVGPASATFAAVKGLPLPTRGRAVVRLSAEGEAHRACVPFSCHVPDTGLVDRGGTGDTGDGWPGGLNSRVAGSWHRISRDGRCPRCGLR